MDDFTPIWACESEALIEYLEALYNISYKNATDDGAKAVIGAIEDDERLPILKVKDDIAYIDISGVLSQEGPSWIARLFGISGTSYKQIIQAANKIKNDSSVSKTILRVNSPGGAVLGCDECYQAIYELAQVKTVEVENHGIIASAAVWVTSPAHKKISYSPVNLMGSVGVVIAGINRTKSDEKNGYVRVKILSRNAPHKQASVETEEGKKTLQELADSIERNMISRIAKGYGITEKKVISDFGQGKVFVSHDPSKEEPDALSAGMIDEVRGQQLFKTDGKRQNVNASQGDEKMSLLELLAQNPNAKEEFEAAIAKAKADEQAKIAAKVKVCSPYLGADCAYNKSITGLAVQVLEGTLDPNALTAAVAAVDAVKENEKSTQAKVESDKQPETFEPEAGQDPPETLKNGVISSDADLNAAIKEAKGE